MSGIGSLSHIKILSTMLLGSKLTTPREYLSSLDLQWETFRQSSLKPCGPQLHIQYVAPQVSMWSELSTIQGSLRRYIFQKLLLAWLFSCINKKKLLNQGDGYLWSHFCMNILYISHRSLFAPTYSFWAIGSMLIYFLVWYRLQYCDTLG